MLFIFFRPLLKVVIEQVTKNDFLSKQTVFLRHKHGKLLSVIKKILFIFYGFNLSLLIYIPHSVDVYKDYYSITPCVGKIIIILIFFTLILYSREGKNKYTKSEVNEFDIYIY